MHYCGSNVLSIGNNALLLAQMKVRANGSKLCDDKFMWCLQKIIF